MPKFKFDWKEREDNYLLSSEIGFARISTSLSSRMNVLIVYDKSRKAIDGCCQSTPVGQLKTRAEDSLYGGASQNA